MRKLTKAMVAIMLTMALFFVTGCEPEDNPQTESGMPEVETDSLIITPTSVICYGTVLSDGGGDILERGVCWYGDPYPTFTLLEEHKAPDLSDHRIVASGDLCNFSCELNHYGADSIFYFRAYAKNDAGVSYGSEKVLVSIFDPNLENDVPVLLEDLPAVRITSVSDVTESHALCVGAIVADGGSAIVERGFCWRKENSTSYNYFSVQGADFFNGALSNLLPNTTYYVRAYAVNEKGRGYSNEMSFTTEDGDCDCNVPEGDWVDLGLPSGLLWATRNVGASSPEDYGDYFAWGETQPKSDYDYDTYNYYRCDNFDCGWIKYCNDSATGYHNYMDNLTILQPGDDAATVNWGGGARMPTIEEWEELCSHTTCTCIDGMSSGLCFTGSNGNSIFLPAAACRIGKEIGYVDLEGFYWSSSLDYVDYPWYLYLRVDGEIGLHSFHSRIWGNSVRAVCSPRLN